jgi:hypothetical protein
MIHINYPNDDAPSEEWLDRAKALTNELKAAPDRLARNEIIDRNAKVWGEIKPWLEKFSHGKCWFSEARDTFSHWHVEHFRPKKEAKEPNRDGYWWRAFDHLNYRLCGSVGNTKKGSYFPLGAGSIAAQGPEDECKDEAYVLIDPTVKRDVVLLTFADGGIAVPVDAEGWGRVRALVSIKRYNLDFPPLLRARAEIWNQCRIDVDEADGLMALQRTRFSPAREEAIRRIVDRLTNRTRPDAQFSSVARAFLIQDPRPWTKWCIA